MKSANSVCIIVSFGEKCIIESFKEECTKMY